MEVAASLLYDEVSDDFAQTLTNFYFYVDGKWEHRPPSASALKESAWAYVRRERDRCLLTSDWTQLPDVSPATKDLWAPYRQALRDITLQPDPFNIVWPTPPQ